MRCTPGRRVLPTLALLRLGHGYGVTGSTPQAVAVKFEFSLNQATRILRSDTSVKHV